MKIILTFLISLTLTLTVQSQTTIANARQQSIGSTVTITGIVTNGDEFGAPLRYIQDATGGIAAYSNSLASVTSGDSILITGVLKSYNGLLELDPVSSFTVISQNNPLPAPKPLTLTTGFIEAYEGQLVIINSVKFVNSGVFSSSSSNYDITNGTTTREVRILSTTNIGGTPIPSGNVNIIGLMGEFNGTYQLQPRSLADLEVAGPKFTSNLRQENISTTGFNISFTTQNNGSTIVRYGTTPALGSVVGNGIQTTNHSVALSGLQPATIYYVQALSINTTNDTSISAIQAMATKSLSSGNIKVYFNRPIDNSVSSTGISAVYLNQSFDDTIISYIDKATSTLDIAIYNMDNQNFLIDAINAAQGRGVQVRLIANEGMSSTNYNQISVPKKKSPTGPAPSGGFYGLMHNKFVIIDAHSANPNVPIIITGSTNFTDAQLLQDANNMVIVQDQSLAKSYELEFEEMWSGKFGSEKTANTPTDFIIGENKVELHFSPTDAPEENLKKAILSADEGIYFNIFTWTRYNIAYDIKDRADAGVFIAGVVDDTSNGGGQAFDIVYNASPNTIFKYNQPGILHHKYMIIDPNMPSSDPQVLTGSYNWTNNGAYRNDENYLIIHDDTIANLYYQEWVRRYKDNGGVIIVGRDEMTGKKLEILIYPNPAKDLLFVSIKNGGEQKTELTLFDLSGRAVLQESLSSNSGNNIHRLNIPNLSAGIYLLQVNNKKIHEIHKLIISK